MNRMNKHPLVTTLHKIINYLSRLSDSKEVASEDLKRMLMVSPFFDEEYYLKKYPDIREAGVDAYLHYIENGYRENRIPCEWLEPDVFQRCLGVQSSARSFGEFLYLLYEQIEQRQKEDKIRIACLTYGDKNIRYKDIVTLTSIKRYNDLDAFSATTGEKDQQYLDYLYQYNIYPIPFDDLTLEEINKFDNRNYRPFKEVFAKFVFPYRFFELGYDYLITVDADILCKGYYDFNEILPYNELITRTDSSNLHNHSTQEFRDCASMKFGDRIIFNRNFANLGFNIFNIKEYVESDFLTQFRTFFNETYKFRTNHPRQELVFGVIEQLYNIKNISILYNLQVAWRGYRMDAINLHSDAWKPWTCAPIIKSGRLKYAYGGFYPISFMYFMKEYCDYIFNFEFANLIFKNGVPDRKLMDEQIFYLEKKFAPYLWRG